MHIEETAMDCTVQEHLACHGLPRFTELPYRIERVEESRYERHAIIMHVFQTGDRRTCWLEGYCGPCHTMFVTPILEPHPIEAVQSVQEVFSDLIRHDAFRVIRQRIYERMAV